MLNTPTRERLQFTVEDADGNYNLWNLYAPALLGIQRASFPEQVSETLMDRWFAHQLEIQCSTPGISVVLLMHDGTPVGMSSFSTANRPNKFDEAEKLFFSLDQEQYRAMQRQTAEVGTTAILPEFRGQGGWTQMMNRLDRCVEEQGYQYMLRWVREANNYSQKVEWRYHDKIIFSADHLCHGFGPQKYFRVKI